MPASQTPGPTVLRIKLGAKLRRLREARGISAQQAADAIRGSDSKISRIELGRHVVRVKDVKDLLDFYDVTDPAVRQQLLALADAAFAAPWWQRDAELLPKWFQAYLGFEEAAQSVLTYDTHFVTGLLQTPDYTQALLRQAELAQEEAERLLAVRAERIDRFAAGGWRLTAIIDEAVLFRPVPDAQVFVAQLRHLRDASLWPGVTVFIRRLTAGAPPAPVGFSILRFGDTELADVVYTEQLTTASCLDRPADVARYESAVDSLRDSSQPQDQTVAIINGVLARLN